MKNLILIFCTLFILNSSSAQETEYQIDLDFELCLDHPNTNSSEAIQNCFQIAKDAWLAEIEVTLDSLYLVSKWQNRKAITNTQREWEKYLIAENRYVEEVYNDVEGGLWATVYNRAFLDIIKQRAVLLKAHLIRQQ